MNVMLWDISPRHTEWTLRKGPTVRLDSPKEEHKEVACVETQARHPQGADVIVGADVVYVEEAVPLLFSTAAALLSKDGAARLVLAHTSRRVGEDRVVGHAAAAGFKLLCWSEQVAAAAELAGIVRDGHMRLLVFTWAQL